MKLLGSDKNFDDSHNA